MGVVLLGHGGTIVWGFLKIREKVLDLLPQTFVPKPIDTYTLSEAWSRVNWADLMAAQGAFGTDFYDRSTRTVVSTMLWTEYRPVIKIGPKGALGRHEIRPIHSAPSLGQSIYIIYNLKCYFVSILFTE